MGSGGGYEVIPITPKRSARNMFRELLPLLTSRTFCLRKNGAFCEACEGFVMVYGRET